MAVKMVDTTADLWVDSRADNWVDETVDSKADNWVVWMAASMVASLVVLTVGLRAGWLVHATAVRLAVLKAVS
jgi:hypothetical protein